MASESNAHEPQPATSPSAPDPTPAQPAFAAPTVPAGAQPQPAYAPPRPAFTTAPVGWTIAAMLTFWPTGIPALLASHRAARAFGAADHETAQRESANARRWGIVSVCVAAGLLVLNVLFWIAWFAFVALAVHSVREDGFWDDRPGWSDSQLFDGQQHHGRSGGELGRPPFDGPDTRG